MYKQKRLSVGIEMIFAEGLLFLLIRSAVNNYLNGCGRYAVTIDTTGYIYVGIYMSVDVTKCE